MEFKIIVDNQQFVAPKESFEKQLRKMELMYKYNNVDKMYLALILLDCQEAKMYVVSEIQKFITNLHIYDYSISSTSLYESNHYIKTIPTLFINIEKYFLRLSIEKNISVDEAKELVFMGINIGRDSVFLENNAKFIMFLNDESYYQFKVTADDFCDYCRFREDFNQHFINENGLSLSEYYRDKSYKKKIK